MASSGSPQAFGVVVLGRAAASSGTPRSSAASLEKELFDEEKLASGGFPSAIGFGGVYALFSSIFTRLGLWLGFAPAGEHDL